MFLGAPCLGVTDGGWQVTRWICDHDVEISHGGNLYHPRERWAIHLPLEWRLDWLDGFVGGVKVEETGLGSTWGGPDIGQPGGGSQGLLPSSGFCFCNLRRPIHHCYFIIFYNK